MSWTRSWISCHFPKFLILEQYAACIGQRYVFKGWLKIVYIILTTISSTQKQMLRANLYVPCAENGRYSWKLILVMFEHSARKDNDKQKKIQFSPWFSAYWINQNRYHTHNVFYNFWNSRNHSYLGQRMKTVWNILAKSRISLSEFNKG